MYTKKNCVFSDIFNSTITGYWIHLSHKIMVRWLYQKCLYSSCFHFSVIVYMLSSFIYK